MKLGICNRPLLQPLGLSPHSLLSEPTLERIVDTLNDLPTQFATTRPGLSQDTRATQLCHPLLLETCKPVVTLGDGNCLYRALSLTLTSSQILHVVIRLLCVHALLIHRSAIIEAMADAYHLQPRANIVRMYTQDLRNAVTLGAWGTDHHIFALSLLFGRPIFTFHTFYSGEGSTRSQLELANCRDVQHLAQRFRDYEPETRKHFLSCSNAISVSVQESGLTNLKPLFMFHVPNTHWVAMLPLSQTALSHIPIPRTRLLCE